MAGKYYTECLIQSFDRMYDLDLRSTDFLMCMGNIWIPQVLIQRYIFNWLNSIKLGNNSITIQGNPEEKILDLVYVSDVVEAIVCSTLNSTKKFLMFPQKME